MSSFKGRTRTNDGAPAKIPVANPVNLVNRGAQAKLPIQSARKMISKPVATPKPKE